MMRRGLIHAAWLGGLGMLRSRPARADDVDEWQSFKRRFVEHDGRVIDTGNGGQSHSEGQGWTLLFAERFDDRPTFNRVLEWTERVLRRRNDRLHAWRCRPGPALVVDDPNNATDGDLCISWALIEAGQRWGDPALRDAGVALAADIMRLLLRQQNGRWMLLPGISGFASERHTVINPSYYVFPAFPVLAEALPDPAWTEVAADGLNLLDAGRFGQWNLPPDWLSVSAGGTSAPTLRTRFSYDAVRLPLYMSWAGLADEPAVQAAHRFWSAMPRGFPDWIDVRTNETSGSPAPSGMHAIARLVSAASAGHGNMAQLPRVADAPDYYSAALTLLARLAWQDLRLPQA